GGCGRSRSAREGGGGKGPAARADVEHELARHRRAVDRRHRRAHDRMPLIKLDWQGLAGPLIPERLPIVQRELALLVVELDDELADELAADDAVDRPAQRRGKVAQLK